MLGVDSVEVTCTGCYSEENAPEFFCHGVSRYLYFRCETKTNSTLIWNVSPLLQEPVILGPLSPVDNIIRREGITVLVDTVDFAEGRRHIISYLWLDLGSLNSDVNVSCSNGRLQTKALKLLGKLYCAWEMPK